MTTAIRTDRQMLLAAVRRGDFQSLLALVDWWQENGCEMFLKAWSGLVLRTRWHLDNRKKVRMGVLESMTRLVRDFLYFVNRYEGKPWRLPPFRNYLGCNSRSRTYRACWDWCRDMADALIRYVKATV